MGSSKDSATGHVRDKRNGKWWWCHNVVIDHYGPALGPHGIAVYVALCRYANDDGACWPSIATIGRDTGMSPNRVRRSLSDLERAGLISIMHRPNEQTKLHQTSIYTLLEVDESTSRDEVLHHVKGGTSPREVGVLHDVKGGTSPREAKEDSKKKTQLEKDPVKKVAAPAAPPPPPPPAPSEPKTAPQAASPKKTGRAAQETPEETAYYRACVPVMARAAELDLKVDGVWAQCQKALRALYHAEVRPTPDLIEREFVRRDGYWYTQFWKGRDKNEPPEPHDFPGNWKRAMTWRDKPPLALVNGKAQPRAAPPQEDGIAALRARLTGQPPDGSFIEGRFRHG